MNGSTAVATLRRHLIGAASIDSAGDAWRLSIHPTPSSRYVDAQLDDYGGWQPLVFQHKPPLRLTLFARFSHRTGALKGTAGFGFWNHPFGAGGAMLPRSVWYFYSSPQSDLRFGRKSAGHGFCAAMLDALPFWRRPSPLTRPATAGNPVDQPSGVVYQLADRLSRSRPVIALAVRVAQRIMRARERQLTLDITQWHRYEIDWTPSSIRWRVDEAEVFACGSPPPGPLGFVAWIDNYTAHFSPNGRYGFGFADINAHQWIEIKSLALNGRTLTPSLVPANDARQPKTNF
jgi:hypothetical protein